MHRYKTRFDNRGTRISASALFAATLSPGCEGELRPHIYQPPVETGGHSGTGGAASSGGGTSKAAGGTTPTSSARICDGSDDVRLSIVATVGLGQVPLSQILPYQNGARFVYVRGDCRYWVSVGDGHVQTGLLGDREEELARDLFYGEWIARGLDRGASQPGLLDATPLTFSDGTTLTGFTCVNPCQIPGAAPETASLVAAGGTWIDRLWALGEPVSGPIRYAVVDDPSLWGQMVFATGVPAATWPLSRSPADAVVEASGQWFTGIGGVLLIDEAEVRAMRELWDRYTSGEYGELAKSSPVPVREPGADGGVQPYSVVFRDVTPFEGADGYFAP